MKEKIAIHRTHYYSLTLMFVEIQGVPSRYVENSQVRRETGVHPAESAGWFERQP